MEMEFGKEVQGLRINIKGNMPMIKNVVMGYLAGRVVIYIKVIILMMFGMDMDKCIGMIIAAIKVCGKKVYNMDKVR
jgi:hypothetical protein